jgi:type IV secretory pathway VirB10-like protein
VLEQVYANHTEMQLSFERRVSVSQLVITITIFVFMALSQGTFSALSPIMAAQQKERRRREAIDQSAALLNAVKKSLRPQQTRNEKKSNPSPPSPPPIKPTNPRRHSDNPYYFMNLQDQNTPSPKKSKYPSYEALGIDVENNKNVFSYNLDSNLLNQKLLQEQEEGMMKENKKLLEMTNLRKRRYTSPSPFTPK